MLHKTYLEWDERGEDGSDKQLWEDNWDDDNVEDEFSCQLRCVPVARIVCGVYLSLIVCSIGHPLPNTYLCRAELEKLGERVTQPEPMKS